MGDRSIPTKDALNFHQGWRWVTAQSPLRLEMGLWGIFQFLPCFWAADQRVEGEGELNVLPEMVIIILTTDIAPDFVDFFDDQSDVYQTRKGNLFTNL